MRIHWFNCRSSSPGFATTAAIDTEGCLESVFSISIEDIFSPSLLTLKPYVAISVRDRSIQRKIISEGEDGICKECMDIEYEYCQRAALEREMDEVEAEKKKELSHLELFHKFKYDGDEEKHAKYRIEIEECCKSRLRTLHEQKENLGKKNVEVLHTRYLVNAIADSCNCH